jgi:hypothetical protein
MGTLHNMLERLQVRGDAGAPLPLQPLTARCARGEMMYVRPAAPAGG